MLRTLLLFASLTLCSIANADPILKQITKNAPELSKKDAKRTAQLIKRVTTKYKIPANIFTAILMQESRYNQSAHSKCWRKRPLSLKESVAVFYSCMINNKPGSDLRSAVDACNLMMAPVSLCHDVGIAQINYKTMQRWGFNYAMLKHDISYNIDAGAQVLADFYRRYGKYERDWWTRYNSSNPAARMAYERRVRRWL